LYILIAPSVFSNLWVVHFDCPFGILQPLRLYILIAPSVFLCL
jgi:hypothetical protein